MNRAAPEALNQPSELLDYNLFSTHSALQEALAREGAAAEHPALTALGERPGVLTPAAKYWICKRAPAVCAEAMEVLGGNGYVEEGPIARRFRESPLNSIWEGSGNIMCLDVLRALTREPRTREALETLLAPGAGSDAVYDRYLAALREDLARLSGSADSELRARELTQRIALAAQAALFLAHGPAASCEAFLASRLAAPPPAAFGTLPAGSDFGALTARIFNP